MSSSVYIRPVRPSDDHSLSNICLLTGNAGSSAASSHTIPELLGLIYALPYNRLETAFGFVLVDTDNDVAIQDSPVITRTGDKIERVVGYILGTTDSKKFEEIAELEWWPALREKYPKAEDPSRTPSDQRCISVIHSPSKNPEDITSRHPAHIHIDILPSHQRKSHGKKLMASAMAFLRDKGHTGLFVGLDPSNEPAKKFYGRLGFERVERNDGEWWELDFDRFRE